MKKTLALILAIVMTMALVACGGKGTTSTTTPSTSTPEENKQGTATTDMNKDKVEIKEDVKYKEKVVLAYGGKTTTIDPQVVSNIHHDTIFKLSHNSLICYDWDKKEMVPELATEWSVAADGKTWTFKLRNDVEFHNGEKMTADDVVFTFERAKETGVSGSNAYTQIESIKAVDDYTVEMTLTGANADWLYLLQYTYCSILNREAVEKDPVDGAGIGTGGWKISKWENGADTHFERYDNSWVWKVNPLTPTKQLVLATMTEDSARVVATQTGEVDFNISVPLVEIPVLEKDEKLQTATINVDTIYFLGFNNQTGICSDVNMRKAISYAVDPQELLIAYYEGYGNTCETFWGPNQYGIYTDYADPLETNLDKAKEFLAKTNYNGETLRFVTITSFADTAALMQAQLLKVGIKSEIVSVDSQGLNATCKALEFDFFYYNKSCGPHGDQFRTVLTYGHNTNRAQWNSPRVMELLDLAVVEQDDAKRKAMYQEIQQIAHDEMPYRPLFYGTNGYAWGKNVSGTIWCGDNKHDYTFIVCAEG